MANKNDKDKMLSKEQQQLIQLLFEGNNNLAIAAILGIPKKTLDSRINTLYKKFNVKNRLELRLKI